MLHILYHLQALDMYKQTKPYEDFLSKLDDALTEEQQLLALHWSSSECQEKFKQYLNTGKW